MRRFFVLIVELLLLLLLLARLILAVVVKTKVLHDLEQLLHQNSPVELRLAQNLKQVTHLFFSQIINTKVATAFKQTFWAK